LSAPGTNAWRGLREAGNEGCLVSLPGSGARLEVEKVAEEVALGRVLVEPPYKVGNG
jgi:hypothetical protein